MSFLEYEVTRIPRLLKNQFGNYYNNALGNGVFWAVVLWSIFRLTYENMITLILMKFSWPYYIRKRAIRSSWYLLFFVTNLYYCKYGFLDSSVVFSNELINWNFVYISCFYLHIVIWEIQNYVLPLHHLFFTLYIFVSYLLKDNRVISVMAALSIVQISVQISRLSIIVKKRRFSTFKTKKLIIRLRQVIFYTTMALMAFTYIVTLPFIIIIPLVDKIKESYEPVGALFTLATLLVWLLIQIYNSPLKRLIDHIRNHRKEYPPIDCLGTLMECTLLKQRDDFAYQLQIHKIEMKERQARMLVNRKPKKGADMLFQTLKCMVVINKKIKAKAQRKQALKLKLQEDLEEKSKKEQNTNVQAEDNIENGGCKKTL